MSHYCLFVLMPKPEDLEDFDPEDFVKEQLEPFDENMEVPPHQENCYCINSVAQREVYEEVGKVYSISQIRDEYHAEFNELVKVKMGWKPYQEADVDEWFAAREQVGKEISPTWEERIGPHTKMVENLLEQHPMKDKPDPDCGECEGSGKRETSYNPQSKWDWWQIGGRWGGFLMPDYDPAKDPQNIENCFICAGTGKRNDKLGMEMRKADPTYTCNGCRGEGSTAKWPTQWVVPEEGNIAPVAKVLELNKQGHELLPFAILRPTGEWCEKGEMGWWAIVSDEKPDWKATAQAILEECGQHLVIVVDCHI